MLAQEDQSDGVIVPVRDLTFVPELFFHLSAPKRRIRATGIAKLLHIVKRAIGVRRFMAVERGSRTMVEAGVDGIGGEGDEQDRQGECFHDESASCHPHSSIGRDREKMTSFRSRDDAEGDSAC